MEPEAGKRHGSLCQDAPVVVQLAREQVTAITTEAPARAPAPGTPHGEAGPAPGSGRAEGEQSDEGGRRRSRSGGDSVGPAATAGLAKDRIGPDPAARSTARSRTRTPHVERPSPPDSHVTSPISRQFGRDPRGCALFSAGSRARLGVCTGAESPAERPSAATGAASRAEELTGR